MSYVNPVTELALKYGWEAAGKCLAALHELNDMGVMPYDKAGTGRVLRAADPQPAFDLADILDALQESGYLTQRNDLPGEPAALTDRARIEFFTSALIPS